MTQFTIPSAIIRLISDSLHRNVSSKEAGTELLCSLLDPQAWHSPWHPGAVRMSAVVKADMVCTAQDGGLAEPQRRTVCPPARRRAGLAQSAGARASVPLAGPAAESGKGRRLWNQNACLNPSFVTYYLWTLSRLPNLSVLSC